MMSYSERPLEDLLDKLSGRVPVGMFSLSKRERRTRSRDAYELLKLLAGQDFGYDEDAWYTWMRENPEWDAKYLADSRYTI